MKKPLSTSCSFPSCKKVFRTRTNLRSHEKKTHQEGRVACPYTHCPAFVKLIHQHIRRQHHGLFSYNHTTGSKIPANTTGTNDRMTIISHSATRFSEILPSPHFPCYTHLQSRSISPLSLDRVSIKRSSSLWNLYDPVAEYDSHSSESYSNNININNDISSVLEQEMHSGTSSHIYASESDVTIPAIDPFAPHDPTSVYLETALMYPNDLDSTFSFPLNQNFYNPTIDTSYSGDDVPGNFLLEHDLPLPSVEMPDADHPPAEDLIRAGIGLDGLEFGGDWDFAGFQWS